MHSSCRTERTSKCTTPRVHDYMALRTCWGGFQLQRKMLLQTTALLNIRRIPSKMFHLSHFALFTKPRQAKQLASRLKPRPAFLAYESLLARMQPGYLGVDMARHGVFWTICLISPRNAVPNMWQRCPAGSDCCGMAGDFRADMVNNRWYATSCSHILTQW